MSATVYKTRLTIDEVYGSLQPSTESDLEGGNAVYGQEGLSAGWDKPRNARLVRCKNRMMQRRKCAERDTIVDAEDRAGNVEGYAILRGILDEAYDQSARGKGHDRHANGRYFDQQPIMEIGRMVGPGFATGQVMKKAQEATTMAARGEADAAVRELLGVIVYAASAVALVREKAPRSDTDRRSPIQEVAAKHGFAHLLKPIDPPASYEAFAKACAAGSPSCAIEVDTALTEWLIRPGNSEAAVADIGRRRREAASRVDRYDCN